MLKSSELFELAHALQPQLVDWRRDFHVHPELAFQEVRSSRRIVEVLREQKYRPMAGFAETGLIARIEGNRSNPCVMLRFDMDALPIQEATAAAYASRVDGVMHACGHDGHMAIGLGVAHILRQIQADLPGSAVLLFQPAEEGAGGALRMLEEGVLDHVNADYALGMHLWNEKPLGWLGTSEGASMAGCDHFSITLRGKGGHAAQPHTSFDPILAAGHLITALQSIVSRRIDPLLPAVLSITQLEAGETFNVIPEQVKLIGTIRTFSDASREVILSEADHVIANQAESFHCQVEFDVTPITPPLKNDPILTAKVTDRIREARPSLTIETEYQVLGSEDMAFFMNKMPGFHFFLGSANAKRHLDASHHHPRFDFDEDVLAEAVFLCSLAALTLME